MYEDLTFGERSPNKDKDCVFVWIYARNCDPYKNYPYNDIPNVSMVLSELRWDGLMGAVGGEVEDGELLIEAIEREVKEEINYDLDITKLKPLSTQHSDSSGFYIHTYSLEVTYEELKKIRENASGGIHFDPENAGISLVHLCKYRKRSGKEGGFCNILKQTFVSNAKQTLIKLVNDESLLIDYYNKE